VRLRAPLRDYHLFCSIKSKVFNMKRLVIVILLCAGISVAYGQNAPALNFYAKKGKGYGFVTSDSLFSLNFQFRIQNRAAMVSKSLDDLEAESFEFRTRRLRLKFEGFVYDPKLTYYIQLSFSRGDMDWRSTDNSSVNNSPNVVRDAVVYYTPVPSLKLGFGQTKLPGNRQRVVSSGDLQFADRSIVNATFNIDRDFGFFATFSQKHFVLKGALTSGEGRNALNSNSGLAYTGRVEILPFGKFTGNNDYIEGDLEREKTPKLSIASTLHYNDKALRQAGQLGNDLYEPVGIRTFEVDALFKYNGWAWYNEYIQRNSDTPVTVLSTDPAKTRFIYVGKGYLTQLSYLFRSNWEIAGRYTAISPEKAIFNNEDFPSLKEKKIEQVEAGVTKYLVGHRVKIQGNIIYNSQTNPVDDSYADGFWSAIFQVELGI
jgi:phosphate-selective porin OprO and OprP